MLLKFLPFLILSRSNGETSTLTLPNDKDRFFVARYPPGKPEEAQVVSVAHSKDQLLQDYFHYYISTPSTALKRCRGCDKPLDYQTLAIQTTVICILCNLYFKLILQIMQFKLQYLSVSKKRACKTGC
jgi:hypothetical protein